MKEQNGDIDFPFINKRSIRKSVIIAGKFCFLVYNNYRFFEYFLLNISVKVLKSIMLRLCYFDPFPPYRLIHQTTNWWFVSYLSLKTGFDISCKLSGDNLLEMSKPIFREKIRMASAAFFHPECLALVMASFRNILLFSNTKKRAVSSAGDYIE